jgi:BolA family transcriptional regulator, general stress-responsive regulator
MPVTADQIEAALRQAFDADAQWQVINESHLHAGHAGAAEGSHWRVRLVAGQLAGLSRVARHRLVYDALRPLIDQGIHALAIDARAPSEA